ncbi:MAG: DUF6321 domain-containing protein [Burkholderiaceae bacterium]
MDLSFDLRAAKARDEINDALGMRSQRMGQTPPQDPNVLQQLMQHLNVQANPQMQQVSANVPLGGGLSAGVNAMRQQAQQGQPQMGPQITNVGLNYQRPSGFSAGISYNPGQKAVGANMRVPFAHGGAVHGYAVGGTVKDEDEIVVEAPRHYTENRVDPFGGFSNFDLGNMRQVDMGGGGGGVIVNSLPQQQQIIPLPQLPAPEKTPILPRGLSVGSVGVPISGPGFQTHGTGRGVTFRAGFQEGGLATSIHNPQDFHDRDMDFINTRNERMREVVGLRSLAKGGGAWTRKEGQNPEGGLNAVGRASLKAQGHDIKPPVSSELAAKSPKAAARRKSFCARMGGMEGPMKDEKGRPTRKALALRKWDC